MKNITIILEPEVARWVRLQAAEREMSVSRYVGDVLKAQMQESATYERAMQQYLALPPKPLGSRDEPLPAREALYDRPLLR
jgi:hypothetical protein